MVLRRCNCCLVQGEIGGIQICYRYNNFFLTFGIMKKDKILETIKDFPKEVNLNDLFEQLLVVEKIEKGLEQVIKGEVVAHEEAVEYFRKKWSK